jgi:lambda family phage portal protein
VKLQSEVVQSIFGTFVTSPYDKQMIQQALEGDEDGEEISIYAGVREGFHERNGLTLNDVKMPLLAPGESIETVGSARAPGEFTPFAHEMLRGVGACAGVSGEQVTGDYSEVNFSSMRVGIVNTEKSYDRRLADFNSSTATPMYTGWLHEAHDAGDMRDVMPSGAPDFVEARVELSRSRWLGTARGWYDPVAERQGAVLGLDAGFDTLEDVTAQQGADWEENIDQRAIELAYCKEQGLPPPKWFGDGQTATQVAQKPEKPGAS